jgi:hypothetical protein
VLVSVSAVEGVDQLMAMLDSLRGKKINAC